ncbi:hypothetical protein H4R18_001766 [Coemansia javaensis]|uniref:Uncharacterized protein n=1 Tax=Coemansia javaensis TaxID=2761396 RepID=A0A9W8LJR8_9FUNG|nr:hypothetical protein H4R18_001766 [Coemansia javaensis]
MLDTAEYRDKLQEKVVVVTGAASGLGKALSEHLAEHGSKVFLVDISPSVEQVAEELNRQHPESAGWAVCDLCQVHLLQGLFDRAVERFGHIDIVVNNAGIANERSLFSQPDHRELEQIVHVNLLAPMEATRIAVRYFRETGRPGVVVNTASVGGLLPVSIMESYGTTKAGLIFFTRSCRGLAPQIRVNAVAPSFANTPLVAQNRLVSGYPFLSSVGLMGRTKVVRAMLRAMCDDTLAGDTLMVAMGRLPEKITFHDEVLARVASYIAGGAISKYTSVLGTLFARALDGALGLVRRRIPDKDE